MFLIFCFFGEKKGILLELIRNMNWYIILINFQCFVEFPFSHVFFHDKLKIRLQLGLFLILSQSIICNYGAYCGLYINPLIYSGFLLEHICSVGQFQISQNSGNVSNLDKVIFTSYFFF